MSNIMGSNAQERKRDYEISERIRKDFYTDEGKKKRKKNTRTFFLITLSQTSSLNPAFSEKHFCCAL